MALPFMRCRLLGSSITNYRGPRVVPRKSRRIVFNTARRSVWLSACVRSHLHSQARAVLNQCMVWEAEKRSGIRGVFQNRAPASVVEAWRAPGSSSLWKTTSRLRFRGLRWGVRLLSVGSPAPEFGAFVVAYPAAQALFAANGELLGTIYTAEMKSSERSTNFYWSRILHDANLWLKCIRKWGKPIIAASKSVNYDF